MPSAPSAPESVVANGDHAGRANLANALAATRSPVVAEARDPIVALTLSRRANQPTIASAAYGSPTVGSVGYRLVAIVMARSAAVLETNALETDFVADPRRFTFARQSAKPRRITFALYRGPESDRSGEFRFGLIRHVSSTSTSRPLEPLGPAR